MNQRTSNHLKAPNAASFVAKMRQVFGSENVTVLHVKEGDFEAGEKQPEGAPCIHGGNGEPLHGEKPKSKKKKAA